MSDNLPADQWLERFKARLVEKGGLTQAQADETVAMEDPLHDSYGIGDNPEEAADSEIWHWHMTMHDGDLR